METWNFILSILVIIHLASEYVHYFLEYFWGRREKSVLEDILKHRKGSTKTERLKAIQVCLDEIRDFLEMERDAKEG